MFAIEGAVVAVFMVAGGGFVRLVLAELLMPFATSIPRRLLFACVVLSLRPVEIAFNKI